MHPLNVFYGYEAIRRGLVRPQSRPFLTFGQRTLSDMIDLYERALALDPRNEPAMLARQLRHRLATRRLPTKASRST
jgi:hypothetical protein